MNTPSSLQRFLDAQNETYLQALNEIENGRKRTHWMWFIFPQLAGLGFSETARFYAISDLDEASNYLAHPVLGQRLIEISRALLQHEQATAHQIFGSPDDLKLRSSMTLFGSLKSTDPVFQAVLDCFFDGQPDQRTLDLLAKNQ